MLQQIIQRHVIAVAVVESETILQADRINYLL